MKENLTLWLLGFGATASLGLLLFALKKFGPMLLDKFLGSAIRKAISLDEGNPVVNEARKRMILAQMVYLELKIPDRGKGADRKDCILKTFGEKAGPIVDELVSQLDDELKKLRDELQPAGCGVPPAPGGNA